MGQRKEIIRRYVSEGMRVKDATGLAGISKSSYYYRPTGKPKGKRPSMYTRKKGFGMVANEEVVEEILDILDPEYNDYGYQIVSHLLRRKGYQINHKKVYRLMRDHQLLHRRIEKGKAIEKVFIKETVPALEKPFSTIEADIKYVYIHGENRNSYLLTFLCTFTRFAPVWDLGYRMPGSSVINLAKELLVHPEVNRRIERKDIKVVIRTDNGPQFIAKKLAQTLEELEIRHEFIRPGTPQQNGHIESFHSTVTRLVCNRNIFNNIDHARKIFTEFYYAYNYIRVMKPLLYYPPAVFLKLWDRGLVGIKKNKRKKEIFFFREKPTPELEADLSSEVFNGLNKNNIFDNMFLKPKEISPVL